jgi:tetratricopeptide (TPR) repeat protein
MTALLCIFLFLSTADASPQQRLTEQAQQAAYDHFRKGMQDLMAEHYPEAERNFRSAVQIDPHYDAAFYGLGQVYMATKRYPEAVRAYLDSREAFKGAVAAERAGAADAEKRLRDQIQALKDNVARLERTATQSANAQNEIYRERDMIRQLEIRLNRFNTGGVTPVPAGLSMALGSAYFRTGDTESAEREYLEAIKADPQFGEAHNNLAVIYMLSGRIEQANQEVALAEKAGFRVSPQFKQDLKKRGGS